MLPNSVLPSPVYAQAAGSGDIFGLIVPLILIGGIMYFLIFRPQRAQMKAREQMLANIRRNDTIVTGGGIVGKVTKVVDEREVEVEIAKDVKIRVLRSLVADVRSKNEPVKETGKSASDKK